MKKNLKHIEDLDRILKENGLYTINVGTTFGLYEYDAVAGFASLEAAEEFAEKYGLKVNAFRNEGGTSPCYVLYDENPHAEFDVYSQYKEHATFCKGDAELFQSVDIDEALGSKEFGSEREKAGWLAGMQAVKARIESLSDDEFVYLDNSGVYSEPLKKEDTSNEHNGDYYVIGVC